MKDARNYIIIGLVIALFFLLKCEGEGGSVKPIRSDTVRITHIDTVHFPDTILVTTQAKLVKVRDTVYITNEDTIDVRAYTTAVSDSLIEGEITTTTDGHIFHQELTYTPKFPKYIYRTDSVIITNEMARGGLYLGLDVVGNKTTFDLRLSGAFLSKKNYSLGYSYGLIHKTHSIGFKKRFSLN